MSREKRCQSCTLCAKKIKHPALKDTATNTEYFEKIDQIFKTSIDMVRIPKTPICKDCQDVIDSSSDWFKRCQFKIEQFSKKPKQFQETSAQTVTSHYAIVINQLPNKITKQELEELFVDYGMIENTYLKHISWGESFAHITYSSSDAIESVMEAVKNYEIRYEYKTLVITNLSKNLVPIDVLPDDCLREIFRKLDDAYDRLNLERVCKRWKRIARKSWSNFTEFFHEHDDLSTIKAIMIRCGTFLKDLNISLTCDDPTSSILQVVSRYCENLETFKIDCYLNNLDPNEYLEFVKEIMKKNIKLRRFSIGWILDHFDYTYLNFLPEGMLELHFMGNNQITASMDLSKFVNLVALELIRYELGENTLIGIENLTNLEYLSLGKSHVHPSNINKIGHFTKLKYLEIPNCQINDDTLTKIATNNRRLHFLDISENVMITDHSFWFVTRLPDLKVLMMNNVTNVTGLHLKKMHSLETLQCNTCPGITDLELLLLIDSCPKLDRLQAAGIATRRLIISASETLKSQSDRRKLMTIAVHDVIYRKCGKWNYDNDLVYVYENRDDDDSDMDLDRCSWYCKSL